MLSFSALANSKSIQARGVPVFYSYNIAILLAYFHGSGIWRDIVADWHEAGVAATPHLV
jgi:hypothetical protein